MSNTIETINTIPFVDIYLEDYEADDNIKNILDNYNHKILDSSSLELFSLKKIREGNYKTIVFYNSEDFYDEAEHNYIKFNKIKKENNVLLVLKYTTFSEYSKILHSEIVCDVNVAIVIDIKIINIDSHNKIENIAFTNRAMALCIVNFHFHNKSCEIKQMQDLFSCDKKINTITKYLPSSIKIMDVDTSYYVFRKIGNLPNKIIILRIVNPMSHQRNYSKQKYPLKSLLIINNASLIHKNGKESFTNNDDTIKKLILNKNDNVILRTDFFDKKFRSEDFDENGDVEAYRRYHYNIVKNKKTIKLLVSESEYYELDKVHSYDWGTTKKTFAVKVKSNEKYQWFVVSNSVLEKQSLLFSKNYTYDYCYKNKSIKSKILYEENICNLNDFMKIINKKVRKMIKNNDLHCGNNLSQIFNYQSQIFETIKKITDNSDVIKKITDNSDTIKKITNNSFTTKDNSNIKKLLKLNESLNYVKKYATASIDDVDEDGNNCTEKVFESLEYLINK